MKISIIIPTYNRDSIIKSTLDSITAQTYKDWECVVVDDHSTDNTRNVIEEYTVKDCRFKYFVNERKKGAQAGRGHRGEILQQDGRPQGASQHPGTRKRLYRGQRRRISTQRRCLLNQTRLHF